MIERIPDLPENVLGFSAKGKLTANDYETVIIPEVETMLARQGKVRFLYHLGEEFSGIEAAAALDDAKLGLKHFTGWERVAIVSNVEWIRLAVRVFGLAMPGHIRVFDNGHFAEAKRWMSE
jgi:hypothetical protein